MGGQFSWLWLATGREAAPAARSQERSRSPAGNSISACHPPRAEVTDEIELNRVRVTYNHNGTMSRSPPKSQPIWAPDIC